MKKYISLLAIEKIAKKSGAEIVSKDAIKMCKHAGSKTVREEDVID